MLRAVRFLVGVVVCVPIVGGQFFAGSATAAPGDVYGLLNGLRVAAEQNVAYDRDDFKHWVKQGGCDTRQDVLIRDRKSGVPRACTVIGGLWISPYDGVRTADSGSLDIDHMVALGEAARSGAYGWSANQRMLFANDLGYRPSLIAVSASSNRSKGDKDPAQWMPPNRAYWCTYLKDWVGVKVRWKLTVDPAEKAAIQRNLKGCDPKMAAPPVAPVSSGPVVTSKPAPVPQPSAVSGGKTDPRFPTCGAANKAGYGPYLKGSDPEYGWYDDRNKDGKVC